MDHGVRLKLRPPTQRKLCFLLITYTINLQLKSVNTLQCRRNTFAIEASVILFTNPKKQSSWSWWLLCFRLTPTNLNNDSHECNKQWVDDKPLEFLFWRFYKNYFNKLYFLEICWTSKKSVCSPPSPPSTQPLTKSMNQPPNSNNSRTSLMKLL